jgi:tetratricopeptide (TPR) repeat protein
MDDSRSRARSIDALFAQGFARHQAGELQQADRLYRRILELDPDHADSLHLLGLVRAQSDEPEAGVRLIARALALKPDFALAHYNLGNALRQLGRGEAAIDAYREAIRLEPQSPGVLVNLGVTLRDLGRTDEAVEAYRRALAYKPGDARTHYNLGIALNALGRGEEAAGAYRRAVALAPDHADAWTNLAASLLDVGRTEEAAEAGRRAVALAPDDAGGWVRLGGALRDLGLGMEAVAAYERAALIDPGAAWGWVNLAIALQETGRADEARTAIDRALTIDPRSAAAWSVRGDLKTFAPGDPDLVALTDLLASASSAETDAEARLDLEFTLGKALIDVGDAEGAFVHLNAGNRLARAALPYDVREDEAQFAAIAGAFDAERMAAGAGGDPSDRPVFIVGMPRSGTTLVEQILASHPEVHGAGELPTLEAILIQRLGPSLSPTERAGRLADLTPVDFVAMGCAYTERLAARAPDARRVTDKMPSNFRWAGLIRLMLPNARIVHCRRDPIDTCLSCYMRKFSRGQPFAYDLRDLGLYYRAYEALMAHWRSVLPADRFIEVQYEAVVDDLESQAHRLVDFCGLGWDDACLAFHEARRPVRTASVNQVRQPLYRTSVARWKAYEAHLGPLLDALGRSAGSSVQPAAGALP